MGNAGCKDVKTTDETDSKEGQILNVTACNVDELRDGEMREVAVGDGKVLLVKEAGAFHAIGAKCTHFGAPLSKGAFCNGRVRCPWHGACFNIKTGDIEDFPGLDSIPTFKTSINENKVVIHVHPDAMKSHKRVRSMTRRNKASTESIVIIGGGPAALKCAETLRAEGFDGQVQMVTKDKYLPYDRSRLSKSMKATPKELEMRSEQFYKDCDIDVRLSSEVVGVDTEKRNVKLKSGTFLTYTKLLIATGGTARRMEVEGGNLEGIFTLRAVDDANTIIAAAADKHVVVVGGSFIAIESACFLADKVKSIVVVLNGELPLYTMGKEIGNFVKKLFDERNNISFRYKTSIKSFAGENGKLSSIVLSDGSTVQADVCILGIGVTPNTEFLKETAVQVDSNGYIEVNQFLETRVANVFAAGDITSVILPPCKPNDKINIQHWQMAHKQGHVAALNMLGKSEPLKSVPFFWTVIFGKSIRIAGTTKGDVNNVVVHKEENDSKILVFYIRNDIVTAVASINFDPVVAHFAEILFSGKTVAKQDISDGNISKWLEGVKR